MKRLMSIITIHLDIRRGTQVQAIEYCRKEDTRQTDSEPYMNGQPHRGDGRPIKLKALATKIVEEGLKPSYIAREYPHHYIKHHNGIQALYSAIQVNRNHAMEVTILVGQTGTGKSYLAHTAENTYDAPWPEGRGVWWWPNYEHEDTIILEEFRHQVTYDKMLHLLDRYPFHVQYKGGYHTFNSNHIIITTNIPPEKWYPHVVDVDPLRRRIIQFARIYDFDDDLQYDAAGVPNPHCHERPLGPRDAGFGGAPTPVLRRPEPGLDWTDLAPGDDGGTHGAGGYQSFF